MKIPFNYVRLSRIILVRVFSLLKKHDSTSSLETTCRTVRMYDSNRNEIIRKLLREKSALLKTSFWPWRRDLIQRHKAINLQLEAMGVYQGKIN